MPSTDPAHEWDWYSSRDFFIGTAHTHGGPFEDAVDEEREEIREKDKRRLPRDQIGFRVPPEQPPKRKRRRAK